MGSEPTRYFTHQFEEPQLLGWKRLSSLTWRGLLVIDHQGLLRGEEDQ
jgi:hypothetical protein